MVVILKFNPLNITMSILENTAWNKTFQCFLKIPETFTTAPSDNWAEKGHLSPVISYTISNSDSPAPTNDQPQRAGGKVLFIECITHS